MPARIIDSTSIPYLNSSFEIIIINFQLMPIFVGRPGDEIKTT